MIIQDIKSDCQRLKISQSQLAQLTGISRFEISRYFSGKRQPLASNLDKMLDAIKKQSL